MRKSDVIGGLIFAAFLLSASSAQAGPWEDGMAAYNRGDCLPPNFTAVSPETFICISVASFA